MSGMVVKGLGMSSLPKVVSVGIIGSGHQARMQLEALAAGVAPLVLDTPIARETCADAARYVPPAAEPAQVAQELIELLSNAAARRQLLQHADAVLTRYDWDLAAGDTLKILEEASLGR